jgi:exopolyphosphatase/guanosine-5'-triphosphate,3'-diphosphate pyrophosphatase
LKAAAIDIGSNAIRLLISEVYEYNNEVKTNKLTLVRAPIRLGEDVFTKEEISPQKTELMVKAMQAFKNLMDVYGVKIYKAVATSAMREAKNGHQVAAEIEQKSGVKINIISGDLEANLINSTYSGLNLSSEKSYLYIDVGGGSTELTLLKGIRKIKSHSFKVGTVRLLQEKVKSRVWEDISNWLNKLEISPESVTAIGTGGNINKISKLMKAPNGEIEVTEFEKMYDELVSVNTEDRKKIYNLKDDRADVIVPAAKIYLHVLRVAQINNIFVPKIGLADGIIASLYLKEVQK